MAFGYLVSTMLFDTWPTCLRTSDIDSQLFSRLVTKVLGCPEPMLPMPMSPMLMRCDGGGVSLSPTAEGGTIVGPLSMVLPFFELHPAAASARAEVLRNRRRERGSFILAPPPSEF